VPGKRMMRVAHINSEDASWIFFVGQGRYMRSRGIQLHAISSPGEYSARFADEEGVLVHAVPISRSITPVKDLVSIVKLWRTLRVIRPEIAEAHTTKVGLVGMIASWLARVPIRIYHNHGIAALSAKGAKLFVLRWSDRVSCRLAHRVIFVAPSVRDAALAEGLCKSDKARAVLSINGLDAAGRFNPSRVSDGARLETRRRYGIPADARVLGFVGRIFQVKGIEDLLQAWDHLSVRFVDLHLLIVGASDSREPISEAAVNKLRRDPRIHLTGYVKDTPLIYAAMDVLTLPSYHEGLGYVLIEAAAMNLPVVGTRIPGIVDAMQEGTTGLLVEPGDSAGLASAIARYLSDPDLRRKHGQAGREYVLRNFVPEKVWGNLYHEYADLLSARGLMRDISMTTSPETSTATVIK